MGVEATPVNNRHQKGLRQIAIGVALLLVTGTLYLWGGRGESPVRNFAECAAGGFSVMESYPRQCKGPDGQTFREDIGNELLKDDLIRVATPRPNTTVASPLTVRGMARGNWFFEARFPVKLLNNLGKDIARGIAQANPPAGEDWMTTEFIPFEATLTFIAPISGSGTLVLEKDNPSGLPEHADELRIPVTFEQQSADTTRATTACIVTGCSGQICADEEAMTTCEYRADYACYRSARCERQSTGACGWTETSALRACLNNTR